MHKRDPSTLSDESDCNPFSGPIHSSPVRALRMAQTNARTSPRLSKFEAFDLSSKILAAAKATRTDMQTQKYPVPSSPESSLVLLRPPTLQHSGPVVAHEAVAKRMQKEELLIVRRTTTTTHRSKRNPKEVPIQ